METLSDLYLQDVKEDAIYAPEYPISCKELYQDSRFKFNKTQWKNDYPVTVSFARANSPSNSDTFSGFRTIFNSVKNVKCLRNMVFMKVICIVV